MPASSKRALDQPTLADVLGCSTPRQTVHSLPVDGPPEPRTPGDPVVVELFCGLGGWTEGCRRAGLSTVLAVDSSMPLLRIHKSNHPKCTQCQLVLGPNTEDQLVPLIRKHVGEGQPWHLHGSPPCQRISNASVIQKSNDVDEGMSLVMWFLSLVLRMGPDTWSMEEVPHPQLTGALAMLRELRPSVVDVVPSLCMSDYGVPQHRKRCIAGTPRLIRRLRDDAALRKPPPVLNEVLVPPEGATVCMAAIGKLPDREQNTQLDDGTFANPTIRRCMRPVDAVAWTCVARHKHIWCTADYRVVRHFTMEEHLQLQTFPANYRTGRSPPLATTGVGNAVPPDFACTFYEGCEH